MEHNTVIGHENIRQTLSTMLAGGKLPHALMFYGPRGIGKRQLADALAYRLICGAAPEGGELAHDASSPYHAQMDARAHPDYHVLEPEEGKKLIQVEVVRDLLANLSLSADGNRAIIIDAAENMNRSAANALLKTLEEPGEGVHIILVSHNLSRLLPTIVSRCRVLRFSPLPEAESLQVLAGAEKKKEAEAYLPLCPGRPGEALRMAEAGTEPLKAVEDFLSHAGQMPCHRFSQMAESLQRKKLAAFALELLATRLAQEARRLGDYGWATVHASLSRRVREVETLNINPQLALEASFQEIVETLGRR